MRVELRPTIPEDIPQVTDQPLEHRILGITATIDGRVAGVGGMAFVAKGPVVAFLHLAPGQHRFGTALQRAGKRMIAQAKELGIRRLIAFADPETPASERWLRSLGFKAEEAAGREVFVWRLKGE